MEADAVLLDGRNHLLVGNLIVFHVLEGFAADRTIVHGNLFWRLGVGNEMRQHLILHVDGADCVFGGRFVDGGDGNDLIACPEDFRARLLNDLHRLYPGHLLGPAGVNAGDACMGVRGTQDFAGEQAVRVVVVGVFGAAGNFHRTINPRDFFAQQGTACGIGPLVIAHEALPFFLPVRFVTGILLVRRAV